MSLNTIPDVFTSISAGQLQGQSDGLSNISIEVTGNAATFTLTMIGFNSTAGQTAAFPIGLYSVATGPGTVVTTISANGLYRTVDTSAIDRVQMKCTAIASGTATVVYATSNVGGGP